MTLRYALLGFLRLAPMTGYELKKNLDRSTQSFWHAGLNQIYPTLKSLEADGLVVSKTEPQEGKPDRRVYRLTADGQGELLDWLSQPERELSPGKNPAILKLFLLFFAHVDLGTRDCEFDALSQFPSQFSDGLGQGGSQIIMLVWIGLKVIELGGALIE